MPGGEGNGTGVAPGAIPGGRLGRYVPRLAAEWRLDEPERRWRAIDATLCLIDITGFTRLSERLATRGPIGAEELAEVLSQVFGRMLEMAYARGGMLVKFGGDALLLLFRGPDHALHAACTAVELRHALRGAALGSTSVGRLRLRMSVGVHSGVVHLFCIGSSHDELVVAGPAASSVLAAEALAGPGEIVVSSATRGRLAPDACSVERARLVLRWRSARRAPCGPVRRRPVGQDELARYLPTGLRSHLVHGRADAEHRMATVGFLRFSGVQALMAAGGCDHVADALGALMGTVQVAADVEGVTFLATDIDVDGGRVILAAGVPVTHEDDEGRMLRFARRVVEAELSLGVSVGVNRGHVFAGEIGTKFRATYTVIGDTVNLAARLAAAAPRGRVYVGPGVVARSRTPFDTVALAPLPVRGKQTSVQVHELGPEEAIDRVPAPANLPFVGRDDELAALSAALAAAEHGVGGVVVVSGEAGIGKSRLVEEAVATAHPAGVFHARGEAVRSSSPYRAVRDAVRELLGVLPAAPSVMADRLRSAVVTLDPTLVPFLALLGDAAHLQLPESAEVAAIEPRFRRDRVADVLVSVIHAAVHGAVAVVVEDAHWIDDASSQLLDRLARAAIGRPWIMIVVRRDEAGGFVPPFGPTIQLGPLAQEQAEALVVAATAEAPLRPHEVVNVVERSSGIPLYLEQILRASGPSSRKAGLPESLGQLMSSQVDALAPQTRRLLRSASVLGRSFPTLVLEQYLAGEGLELDTATRRELAGYLEPDGPHRVRFRHVLLRDAAYEGLSFRRRRTLHARAGSVIERLAFDDLGAAADALAMHFSLAGDHARAWKYGRLAGHRFWGANAVVEASVQYERALNAAHHLDSVSAADRVVVASRLGECLDQAGMLDAALAAYGRALALVEDDMVRRAELLCRRAHTKQRAGSFRGALRDLTAAARALETVPPTETAGVRAVIASSRARVRQAQERPRAARVLAEQAAADAERARQTEAEAEALCVLEWANRVLDGPGQRHRLPRALRLYEELGNVDGQGVVVRSMGHDAYANGRWGEAEACYRRARTLFDQSGNAVEAALADTSLGELLVNQGRHDEAETLLRRCARVLRALEFIDGATFAETQLARLLIERGELKRAEHLLATARRDLLVLGQATSALESTIHLARCRIFAASPEEALRLLDAPPDGAEWSAALVATASDVRAGALLALGDDAGAERAAAVGIEVARRERLQYELALLLRTRSRTHAAAGRPSPTDEDEASSILQGLGIRPRTDD